MVSNVRGSTHTFEHVPWYALTLETFAETKTAIALRYYTQSAQTKEKTYRRSKVLGQMPLQKHNSLSHPDISICWLSRHLSNQFRTLVSESCVTRAAMCCCWAGAKADVDAARATMLATVQVFMVVLFTNFTFRVVLVVRRNSIPLRRREAST